MGKYVDMLKLQAPSVPDRQQEESAEPEQPRRQRRAEAADAEAPPTAKLAQQLAASDSRKNNPRCAGAAAPVLPRRTSIHSLKCCGGRIAPAVRSSLGPIGNGSVCEHCCATATCSLS